MISRQYPDIIQDIQDIPGNIQKLSWTLSGDCPEIIRRLSGDYPDIIRIILSWITYEPFVVGYKWLLRIWSGQTPFNWRVNNKRRFPRCIWCNNHWINFLSHVFINCQVLKKYRSKYNLSGGWKRILKVDNDLLSTIKFLDEIFRLPCVAKNNW